MKKSILLLLSILLIACEKQEKLNETSELEIQISPAISITKALGDSQTEIFDASLWIEEGSTVKKAASVSGLNATTATLRCYNLAKGEYKVYILANTESYTISPLLQEDRASTDDFKAIVFSSFSDNCPQYTEQGGMPLSLVTTLQVDSGVNRYNLKLSRLGGKVRVRVHNQTEEKDLFIESISFGSKNRKSSFLFDANGELPSNTLSAFPAYKAPSNKIPIKPSESMVLMDFFVFENTDIQPWQFNIRGSVLPFGAKSDSFREFDSTIPELSIIDRFGQTQPITSIGRNESVNIEVYVFFSNAKVKLYFEVQQWTESGDHFTSFD